MKFLVAEVVTAVRSRRGRRNLRLLTRFFLLPHAVDAGAGRGTG